MKKRVASDEVGIWAGEGFAGQSKALSLCPESKGNPLPSLALVKLSDIMDVGMLSGNEVSLNGREGYKNRAVCPSSA